MPKKHEEKRLFGLIFKGLFQKVKSQSNKGYYIPLTQILFPEADFQRSSQ